PPSPWSSCNQSLLASRESALLCNQVPKISIPLSANVNHTSIPMCLGIDRTAETHLNAPAVRPIVHAARHNPHPPLFDFAVHRSDRAGVKYCADFSALFDKY